LVLETKRKAIIFYMKLELFQEEGKRRALWLRRSSNNRGADGSHRESCENSNKEQTYAMCMHREE